ncbi:MAG: ABC transporter permease subunit [Phycisphaerales bacterium]
MIRTLYRKLDHLQHQRWFKILASLIIIGLACTFFVLMRNMPDTERPRFFYRTVMIVLTAGIFITWWLLVIWLETTLFSLFILVATAIPAGVALFFGYEDWAIAIGGMGCLLLTFSLLIRVLLLLLRFPHQILAVAHTVVKESIRHRISAVCIVLLVVLLPIVPLLDKSEPELRYRVQSFLSYSMALTFYIAACMTIFLACSTVAFEIRDRQIWQLMTKPVSRFNYLIGKWVGIGAVNVAVLSVAGLSIFMFVQYLRVQPPNDFEDFLAVENEILVARESRLAEFKPLDPETLQKAVDDVIERDIALRTAISIGDRNEMTERRRIARELQTEHLSKQRTIEAGQYKTYVFPNLQEARDRGLPLKLRFRIHYGADDTHEIHPVTLVVEKNNQVYNLQNFLNPRTFEYVPTMSNKWDIPAQAVGDIGEYDGQLRLSLINGFVDEQGNLYRGERTELPFNFDAEDLEILYTVGAFEPNYIRALMILWIKLGFLAMFGIAVSTVLSFPVATLTTFTIFLAATIGPFLAISLDQFYINSGWRIDQIVVKALGIAMVFLFEPFGALNPSQRLIEGLMIPWSMVLRAVWLLGIVWSGIALLLGFLAFRDRELATYSGQS